jgi:chemotaxis protein methyltransferase CheR
MSQLPAARARTAFDLSRGRSLTKGRSVPRPVSFDLHPKLITEREFQYFQELIYRTAGIWLSAVKTPLLVGRLSKRLRQLGLDSFREYYRVVSEDQEELTRMLDAVSTNETRFFREPMQFEFLENRILPQRIADAASGKRSRTVRVLSAGCSTGQEPYSLAMTLLHHLPPAAGWTIEIVATDLSTRVLEIARSGIWELSRASEIPGHYLKAFMLRGYGEQEGKMKAGPEIRLPVRFLQMNLNAPPYPVSGKFDLIWCRNVLIYFDLATKTRVVHRLLEHLAPEGHLFVGHAESLHTLTGVLRTVVPTIYTHALNPRRRTDDIR